MGRWAPGARGRLAQAAFELFGKRGFEQTTVAEIAARAGLTERTFYRHFADKREVLFAGMDELQRVMVSAVAGAPASAPPIDAVAAGLEAAGAFFGEGPEFPRRRQSIIAASPDLQERDLVKRASLSAALAGELRRRGVQEPAASLAAEAGMSVFRVALDEWIAQDTARELPRLIQESLDALKAVTSVDRA